jgi:hypothetical protein
MNSIEGDMHNIIGHYFLWHIRSLMAMSVHQDDRC